MALDYKSSLARYRRYLQVVQQKPLWQASLYVILSLVLTIVLVVSALRPTLITIAGLWGQIEQGKLIEERMDQKIAVIQQARQEYENNAPRLGLLDEALPTRTAWSLFVTSLGGFASQSGVVIETISIGPLAGEKRDEIAGTGAGGLDFSLTVAGEYPQLKRFIDTLENSRRLVVLTDVTLSHDEDGALTAGVTGRIALAL
ncbi:hypothetical protein A2634_00790 [Candidatus Amesbacteria bacterium RIFCSPHIGHO2_01_FULL_48_32]|uniref:Uncharacterized protein n=1 Tax=Candidatus Amesbacteria bacterium RIFCSPLOWO2_01_FULL_48_25 TaxID=1797259 RepID=A0A1F4ZAU3_9BACT|nr:MAG: hypothetical protein A2634_00790 [Candidatus Amesbacteria bacterium RIFCSPHIGHO2_01_FULL_48_32]OGD03342.1 MAG: hypothetical protein A2989_00740 [Candidatus Amesbacteria bacterium RIFCSPLOWO2_01_FULL_48_25]HJZ05296.1 type 4a pilus biogenesis protein PilO [Patescibacteria group bacterium]